jgi:hypothetical protein
MNCEKEAVTPPRRRKLLDYTKEGRPDMSCNRGTPRPVSPPRDGMRDFTMRLSQLNRSPIMVPITESHHSFSSLLSSTSSTSLAEDHGEEEEEEQVDFILKIPSKRLRNRSGSSDSLRKDLMLICGQQQSDGNSLGSKRSPGASRKDGRRTSLINSVLRNQDMEQLALRRDSLRAMNGVRDG